MDLIKKLKKILNKDELKRFKFIMALIVFGSIMETFGIGIVVPAISAFLSTDIMTNVYISPILRFLGIVSRNQAVLLVSISMFIFFILKNIILYISDRIQYSFIYNVQAKVSTRIFNQFMNKDYTFYFDHNPAELLRVVYGEVSGVFVGVIIPGMTLLSEILVCTFVFIMLASIQPITTIFSALVLGGSLAVFYFIYKKIIAELGNKRQSSILKMYKSINEAFGAIKEIKVKGMEEYFIKQYQNKCEAFQASAGNLTILSQSPRLFLEVVMLGVVLSVIAIYILRGQAVNNMLSVLAVFAMAAIRLMPSANRIINSISSIRSYTTSVDIIYKDLSEYSDKQTALKSKTAKFDTMRLKDAIVVKKLYYKYPGKEDYVLKDVDISIPIGKSVAFIGGSGAGKTTLVDIILGLLRPTKGTVLADNKDIFDNISLWQSKIGYVAQNIYLSDDTIRRNVAFAMEDNKINDEKVWEALEKSQLKEFVLSLPQKLDTVVGDRGICLSGGQRQRIGIARALFFDPEVLVLDEATSALDYETESEIMDAIYSLQGKKTLIIIAHRLSTIQNADIKFKVDEGRVVESI